MGDGAIWYNITPILFKLHWLPVTERITFKLLLITFKALHGQAPSYISELLNIYQPSRSLRSSSLKYLSVPKCNTVSYGHRAFSVASAKLWTLYLTTLYLLKISTLLKLVSKLFFLRERLICISQMFYYSFHFNVIVFHLYQLIFFPCIFK